MQQVGQQAEQRARALDACGPRRTIRRIDLHHLDLRPFRTQQLRELACLVGHAARRRRQRADKKNTKRGEIHHSLRTATGHDRLILSLCL